MHDIRDIDLTFSKLTGLSSIKKKSLLEIKRYQKNRYGLHNLELESLNNGGILNDDDKKLAAYERDYWTGLHKIGIFFDDANKFIKSYYDDK